jgi:hypothetical protein
MLHIRPLAADVRLRRLEQPHGFASAGTALPSARDATLGASHLRGRAARVARVCDDGAVAQGREVRQADIDADALRRGRQRPRIHFPGEAREPLARFALDRQRLDPAVDGPMALDLDGPDLGAGAAYIPAAETGGFTTPARATSATAAKNHSLRRIRIAV